MRIPRLAMTGVLALVGALAAACGGDEGASPTQIDGSGTIVSDERPAGDVREVVLGAGADVAIDVGVDPYVVVTGDDNVLPAITTEVNGDVLTVGVVEDTTLRPTEPVRVRIGVPDLDRVVGAGSGAVAVRGATGDLRAEVAGSGALRLAGAVERLDVHVAGSGDVDATMVSIGTATTAIDGSGDVALGPAERLDTRIAGSGSVRYAGDPAVTSETSGSGTVQPLDQAPPAATSTTEWPVVPAPALEGNLLGDDAELPVAVWLPPSYAVSGERYPVVYFLAGYEEAASVAPVGDAFDAAIADGTAPEVIVVGVSGRNSLGGSFYVDSPVTGGWATAVHGDLVSWIDAHYRTRASRDDRVVAGFSMGGFGAIDLAMRHPDVFGSVYALSPGLLAPGGLASTQMFAEPGAVETFLEMQAAVASGGDPGGLSDGARFARAYGSAFAPDPSAGPPWIAYPYGDAGATPDPEVWARWEAGYGGIDDEVREHRDAFASLRGIALDVGSNDPYAWIPEGTGYLADALAAAGVDVRLTTYEGGHGPVSARAGEVLVPFVAEVVGDVT